MNQTPAKGPCGPAAPQSSAAPTNGTAAPGGRPLTPHSIEAEHSLLGALLLDNAALAKLDGLVGAADFYCYEHKLIFGAIEGLITAGKAADVVTVYERLKAHDEVDDCGGLSYLNDLAQSVPIAGNARHYAEIVSEHARRRRLVCASDEIRRLALDTGVPLADTQARAQKVFADAGPPVATPPSFRLRPAAELIAQPPMAWRVKGLLPTRGIAAMYGPPMSGKSFLALDLALAIAEGRCWFGLRVKPCRVVYLALEGAAGFAQRLSAWERHTRQSIPIGVEFITEPVHLVDDVVKLIDSVGAIGDDFVVVVDTLNAATPGTDENASRDMGLVIESAKLLANACGLVLLIAHTGKDEGRGLRGHSSQFAALDGAIQTSNDGGRRSWEAAKVKDGEAGTVHAFRLRQVQLGTDADGDLISSCIVERDVDPASKGKPKVQPRGSNQKIVVQTLAPLFKASRDFGKGGAPPMHRCLDIEKATAACARRMTCDSKHQSDRARDAINGLVGNGYFGSGDGWIWLA